MRIGIMTFHRAENIGAALQAYATVIYLGQYGNAEIIDYLPNSECVKRGHMRKVLHLAKVFLLYPFKMCERERKARFDDFRKKLLCSERRYYGDDDIFLNAPQYDVLVSGSDQILNVTLSGASKGYYLGFADNARKISYASSFGRTSLTEMEYTLIRSELSKFDVLSAREQSAADIISKTLGREDVKVVLDPVFLIKKEEWSKLKGEVSEKTSKYVFVYVMEKTKLLSHTITSISELYKLPIICVYGGGNDYKGLPGKIDKTCGPAEFLSYIDNAEVVVTNSFHGIALSIICGKRFVPVAHSTRNARLENIMDIIGCKEKLVTDSNISEKNIVDGKVAYQIISKFIKESKTYLENALKG